MINERLVTFWWYVFVAVLPWQTVWLVREVWVAGEKWQYGTIGVYISDVVLLTFIISVLVQNWQVISARWRGSFWCKSNITALFVCVSIGYIFVSSFWAADAFLTIYYGIKIGLIASLIYLMQFAQISILRTVQIFVASLVAQAGIGIWQFVAQVSFASTLLGISLLDASVGGVSVVESGGRWLRAYGGQAHPNIFGALMAIGAALSLGFALTRNQERRIFFTASGMTLIAGLLVSFSRSAILALIVGLSAIGIWVFVYQNNKYLRKIYLAVVGAFVLIASVFVLQYMELYTTRAMPDTRLEYKSLDERTAQIQTAKIIIAQNTFFGVGAGNYTNTLRVQDDSAQPIWQYQPVHNAVLLMLAELGIVGIGLILIAFYLSLRNYFANIWQNQKLRKITIIFIATLAILVTTTIFDHWQWDSHIGLFLFAFLCSVLVISNKK